MQMTLKFELNLIIQYVPIIISLYIHKLQNPAYLVSNLILYTISGLSQFKNRGACYYFRGLLKNSIKLFPYLGAKRNKVILLIFVRVLIKFFLQATAPTGGPEKCHKGLQRNFFGTFNIFLINPRYSFNIMIICFFCYKNKNKFIWSRILA